MTEPRRAGDRAALGPERLLAFSDGVVAIGLTLLVLPLADLVPEAAEPERSGLTIITDNLAPVGSFVLSFAVIARFWAAHHRVFDDAPRVGPGLVWINTLWLFTIVVLPFPTEMVGAFPEDDFTLRFYVGTLFASSALLTVMTHLVARSRPREERAAAVRRSGSGVTALLLLLILAVTLVVPDLGYWPLLVLFATSPLERVLGPVIMRRLGHTPD
ncbi:TMEM175 family protein [Actinomycetospora cinnamomea]|uniref:Putative membrane protein n=1 Tax=Actinomycetospora cinnamomea TaxID=663609 RepID=A0A2U1FIW7_9PSEU|nr:TMEM175 family protein [Actinomycetospora cinnamomea]PVZ12112.1 putative membrane protein [Actinomycetospora cinnamomea]